MYLCTHICICICKQLRKIIDTYIEYVHTCMYLSTYIYSVIFFHLLITSLNTKTTFNTKVIFICSAISNCWCPSSTWTQSFIRIELHCSSLVHFYCCWQCYLCIKLLTYLCTYIYINCWFIPLPFISLLLLKLLYYFPLLLLLLYNNN